MKRKIVGRWFRDAHGRLRLQETWVDEGPSAASGVSRGNGAVAATGRRHRGATGQLKEVARGLEVDAAAVLRHRETTRKMLAMTEHYVDRGGSTAENWHNAVSHRRAIERKRAEAGLSQRPQT